MERAIARLPETLQGPLTQAAPYFDRISTVAKTSNLKSAPVKAAVAVTLAFFLSRLYNRRYINNFYIDAGEWDWSREIVLITGGTSGLGEQTARKLAARGIRVVIMDLCPPKDPFPPLVSFYECDVAKSEAVHAVAEKIRADVGDPTVLVNNAAIAMGRTILEVTESDCSKIFGVNILAHFITVKEYLPAMIKKNHGHVITIASMASYLTIVRNVYYSCTKTAAMAFHEGLGQELKHVYNAPRVRTSVIHPSWILTPLTKKLFGRHDDMGSVNMLKADDVTDAIVKQILKGESGQIMLPKWLGCVGPLLRALPNWIHYRAMDGGAKILG